MSLMSRNFRKPICFTNNPYNINIKNLQKININQKTITYISNGFNYNNVEESVIENSSIGANVCLGKSVEI